MFENAKLQIASWVYIFFPTTLLHPPSPKNKQTNGYNIFVMFRFLSFPSGDDNINLAGGPSKFVTDVTVNDQGKCTWSGPATFKVNCEMRIAQWPFDQQTCKLGFGSYTYAKNLLKITSFKDKSQLTSKQQQFLLFAFKGTLSPGFCWYFAKPALNYAWLALQFTQNAPLIFGVFPSTGDGHCGSQVGPNPSKTS